MRFSHSLRPLPLVIALQAAFCSPLWAASFTIPTDSGTATKTLAAGDTGTVGSGASLSLGGATIAVTVTGTSGAATLNNAGTIEQTGTERTIDVTGNGVKLILNNAAGAIISAAGNDVIRTNKANIAIQIDNQGTIWQKSTGSAAAGQAIDSRGIGATSTGSFITNGSATNTAATIRADADDAIRAGSNTTITNYGTIISNGIVNTKCPDYLGTACNSAISASDAIDIGGNLGVVVENYGTISGPRHGITADNAVTVTNQLGGQIIGRNGSGVGSDGTATVTNYGTISGRYAGEGNAFQQPGTGGISTTSNGDGDGVDIDGIGTVSNYGRIEGLGGGGFDSGGKPNGGDGIAMGGGTITNNAGASIWGKSNGILVDDGANGTATAAGRGTAASGVGVGGIVTITNNGTITGDQKVAIGLVGNFDDTVTNGATGVIIGGANAVRVDQLLSSTAAAAIQMGGGNDTLSNSGRIEGRNGMAIDMGDGNDTLHLLGGTVIGSIDGGAGVNTLDTNGTQSFADGGLRNFQTISVLGGNLRVNGSFATTNLTVNGTLQAPDSGAFRTVSVAGNYVQAATGVLEARVGANGASDKLAVTSAATLTDGATIRPILNGYVTDGTTYTLLNAGTLSATAANLTVDSTSNFLTYTLVKDGNDLKLIAHREQSLATLAPQNGVAFTNGMQAMLSTGSQSSVNLLNALESLPNAEAVGKAAAQLAPETNAAAQSAASAAQGSVFSAFDNRIDSARSGGPLAMGKTGLSGGDSVGNRFWLQGLAAIAKQDARKGANGYDLDAQGLAVGYEFDLNTRDMLGFSGGYTQAGSDGKDSGAGDDTDVKSTHVGAYFSRTDASYTLDAGVAISANRYSSQRTVIIPGFTETLSGKYSGYQVGARVEYGIPFALDEKWSGRWLMGARLGYLANDAYSENGGASAQNVGSASANSAQSVLGVEFVNKLSAASSATLRARYLHEFADTPAINATFASGGPSFRLDGTQPARDSLQLGFGYRNVTAEGTTIAIGYDMEIKDKYLGHQLTAKAIWNF
ncbi:autotransporter outer membrane beta-barrel domain-containing protein [Herminiimonas fonticola]|uniref:Outer membrane autotransporter protein n=1 Tax=Herminiimonas fonticola TaxID=303380 RepID=A0A4R6G5X1_9BURK|nr:autotransporter outer membrane beta-barrel domain-containing protein [Herminiimonas fonticola]RBA23840.1 outer membrane autotransporter barrel domain [Herminiimonas fonticola]TDN89842.1 outer membrane autotransporter protein [Herminiimonas fonticola]